jgi:hypothetical protein
MSFIFTNVIKIMITDKILVSNNPKINNVKDYYLTEKQSKILLKY